MSYAYYRFFPGDYMRDTMHLGWLEDMAYRRLIDLYCLHGKPIRNDLAYIRRACRATEPEQQAALDVVLAEFFQLKADGWHQTRCDAELKYRGGLSNAGTAGAKARWNKQQEKSVIIKELDAVAMPSQCGAIANQNQNQNHIKSKAMSGKPDVKAAAIEILEFLNAKARRAYRHTDTNLGFIMARMRDGASIGDCKQVIAKKVREWANDPKMDLYMRPATLFNKTKFDQYTGELVL